MESRARPLQAGLVFPRRSFSVGSRSGNDGGLNVCPVGVSMSGPLYTEHVRLANEEPSRRRVWYGLFPAWPWRRQLVEDDRVEEMTSEPGPALVQGWI